MGRIKNFSLLLEQFMKESGKSQRWITVNEFRKWSQFDESFAPEIAGFLKRIHFGSFPSCPYKVERIERVFIKGADHKILRKYFITRKNPSRQRNKSTISASQQNEDDKKIFTDSDAIEIFMKVVDEGSNKKDGEK